jgi:hypothetical protein
MRLALEAAGFQVEDAQGDAGLIARRSPQQPADTSRAATISKPDVETVTPNGFRIRSAGPPTQRSFDHRFHVFHFPDSSEFTVTVTVDRECAERVARLTRRRLAPGGMFWRMEAERLLSAYLWSEGKAPENRRLVVRDVSRDDIDVAAAWEDD